MSVPIIIMLFISAVYYQKFCLKWKLYSTFTQILISIKPLLIINSEAQLLYYIKKSTVKKI